MSSFICEKYGKIYNSACSNNYWAVMANKSSNDIKTPTYKPKFKYFESHLCCSECCKDLVFYDGSIPSKNMLCGELSH